MERRKVLEGIVLGLGGVLAGSVGAEAERGQEGADDAGASALPSRPEEQVVGGMVAAGRAFLGALAPEQRTVALLPFDSEERFNWHFVPRERRGLPCKRMDAAQREKAHGFLKAGLSQAGYLKATTIISLEDVLRVLEGGQGPARDPELYYFTFFGQPAARETWGWRVEGHHLSLNFTVVRGRLIASTPQFFGANPAEVKEGPRKGLRTLPAEEDLARELLKALDAAGRTAAIIATEAPRDIITGDSRKAEIGAPQGLAASRMGSRQRGLLQALLDEYARAMPEAVARERLRRLREAGIEKIHFAWAGGAERGQPHYYRLQGPTFLVEYDNTQTTLPQHFPDGSSPGLGAYTVGANHVHTVWRDFDGDWGLDLLRLHYDTAPPEHGH
jgi:hypothetical protein